MFLVAPRLESLLIPAALGDVQFESSEPRDLASSVAIGSAQALHPLHASIKAQDTVCVIPRIFRLQNLFECATQPWAVFGVYTREPGIK